MIGSYQDALDFLYKNLPMFQRVGAAAYKKDLANTLRLCEILGNPERKFKSIHVAGTNGKGSTAHMLASVLQTAGYQTGLYTSPHLKDFTERIQINGKPVSETYIIDFVNKIKPAIEQIKPSFFEITVAMAFDYFALKKVDVAIIEVGLGGRLDSTNVITPIASVITNISWDHKDLLGDTLIDIAGEKAGIIKPQVPVVISERQPEVAGVFVDKAKAESAPIFFASDEYSIKANVEKGVIEVVCDDMVIFKEIKFPLRGLYQRKNIPGVLKTMDVLKTHFPVTDDQLKNGLERVVANTNLKGRWQIIAHKPTVVLDTAHNSSGVEEVMKQLVATPHKRLHIVWGMVKDKEIDKILPLLPKDALYYFCQAKIPRALNAEVLKTEAEAYGLNGVVIPDVNEAKRAAQTQALEPDVVFVGGSTFVVAEVEEL
jgi:dihydrofolate synthase/folylpolyglutamate synthase